MILKNIIDEDFVNYRNPSMLLMFPKCSWKCDGDICHNHEVSNLPDIEISVESIVWRWVKNAIADAIVCSGLEPFDSFDNLFELVKCLRNNTSAPIIIYTGYTEEEVSKQIDDLRVYKNIIVKYGRFIPHHIPHYDYVLGVYLSSDNQYAKQIS